MFDIAVIGAGLAGSEAAHQLSRLGARVALYEMRPEKSSAAHSTGGFAELVCSNSLGADRTTSPAGILKAEMRAMDSIVLRAADVSRVPAGGALAVDRTDFSSFITEQIEHDSRISVFRTEVRELFSDIPVIAACGPLMDGDIADALREAVGGDCLSFYDAAAPIVMLDSVDETKSYRAGRYGQADDYVNCPLDRDCYESFVRELVAAEKAPQDHSGASPTYFEGCLPVEVMAARGLDTLRFGPMRPVGLPDPSTGVEPYAVLQLRRDNKEGTMYNLVGFQTNLKWGEQDRVFRMIPALADAEFVRRGVMHRNTFVCAPRALDGCLRPMRGGVLSRSDLFLAGQITGVEGYMESAASGIVAAHCAWAIMRGEAPPVWPRETAIGSLMHYLATAEAKSFQPMNVNLGIFPPLETKSRRKMRKTERCEAYAARSAEAMRRFLG